MRAAQARQLAQERLNVREANLLLAHLLGVEPPQLALHLDDTVEEERLYSLIEQRLAGQPLQYVLGTAGFMGLDFCVGTGVLIPRADTEILVEKAISLLEQKQAPLVADICTGSGAIAVSLAHYLPRALVYATDSSPQALAYAQTNAKANRVAERCCLLPGDLCAPLVALGLRFDLIVCNPPYVTATEMVQLPVEVRQEPELALYGGPDGLDFYRRLTVETKPLLKPGGHLLLEHGWRQQERLAELLQASGWYINEKLRDYGNRARALLAARA